MPLAAFQPLHAGPQRARADARGGAVGASDDGCAPSGTACPETPGHRDVHANTLREAARHHGDPARPVQGGDDDPQPDPPVCRAQCCGETGGDEGDGRLEQNGQAEREIPATALAQAASKHTRRTKGLSQPASSVEKHTSAPLRSSTVNACPVLVEPSEPAGAAGCGSRTTTMAMLAGLSVQIDAA